MFIVFGKIKTARFMLCLSLTYHGAIFLRRFRLYKLVSCLDSCLQTMFWDELKQQDSCYVYHKHNMKWNRDLQFWGCLGSQGSREKSSFNLCKFALVSINRNHNIRFVHGKKRYVTIYVWLHDMDHNMDLNYRRKIRPRCLFK